MKINYQDLQKKIKVKFKNLDLLIKSLTHKSFNTKSNNEKIYHSKKITKEDRVKIDKFLEKEYPYLFSEYLSHYKEEE